VRDLPSLFSALPLPQNDWAERSLAAGLIASQTTGDLPFSSWNGNILSAIAHGAYEVFFNDNGVMCGYCTWLALPDAGTEIAIQDGLDAVPAALRNNGKDIWISQLAVRGIPMRHVFRHLRSRAFRHTACIFYERKVRGRRIVRCLHQAQTTLQAAPMPPSLSKARAADLSASLQRFTSIGQALFAVRKSSYHLNRTVGELTYRFGELHDLRQMRVYTAHDSEPIACLGWSFLSRRTIRRMAHHPLEYADPSEWNEGAHLYFWPLAIASACCDMVEHDMAILCGPSMTAHVLLPVSGASQPVPWQRGTPLPLETTDPARAGAA